MKQGKNTVDGIAHIRIVRTIRKGIVNDGLAVADHPHAGGGIVVISIHLGNGLAQNIRRGHLVDGGLDIIIKNHDALIVGHEYAKIHIAKQIHKGYPAEIHSGQAKPAHSIFIQNLHACILTKKQDRVKD